MEGTWILTFPWAVCGSYFSSLYPALLHTTERTKQLQARGSFPQLYVQLIQFLINNQELLLNLKKQIKPKSMLSCCMQSSSCHLWGTNQPRKPDPFFPPFWPQNLTPALIYNILVGKQCLEIMEWNQKVSVVLAALRHHWPSNVFPFWQMQIFAGGPQRIAMSGPHRCKKNMHF